MKTDITYLGSVINVNSNSIEVEISKDIPSAAPIIEGKLYKIGQIGTFVKIPIGNLILFGIVSSVSNTPTSIENVTYEPNYGSRFLQVQLIGEKLGEKKFEKGIGTYPTINDEVHLVTEEDLKVIYGEKEDGNIEIGKHSSSENLSIYVDLHNFVLRHSAILGSTGSGKSNTTVCVIKSILNDYHGARIVLVDTHGEYAAAFKDKAKVFKINDSTNPLFIPFWAMNFDELSFFLVGRKEGQELSPDKRLREKIVELKKINRDKLLSGKVKEEFITADSPIPFDIHQMWYDFNRELVATYSEGQEDKQTTETEMLIKEGYPKKLIPAEFEPYKMGNVAPYKPKKDTMYLYEKKILARFKDNRYDFMFNPGDYFGEKKDLDELIKNWIDNEHRLTILDLNEVPFELIDISVGLITRIIFDSMYWGRFEKYTGRNRPLLMVFEEAHSYLPKNESSTFIYGYSRKAVEKIYKEGRKFGIGAMVITQRPSEISETILAQVGTFIALRLTNSSDKNTVQSSAPNNMNTLIELLPSLRIGEAINIPTRVRIELMEPRPSSSDPKLVECWKKSFELEGNEYKKVVTASREQKQIKY
ncbi:MAG: DUF853 family protein [Bacteroidetes bacterium]|nr:DUF853 family protein [Bacteroidota bacterium]